MNKYEEFINDIINDYNRSIGHLNDVDGIDCNICHNKGFILRNINGQTVTFECSCQNKRKIVKQLKNAGIYDLIQKYTFENYQQDFDWQKEIYQKAIDFVNKNTSRCFFIGGQTGAGKTHICTAILCELIKKGYSAQYKIWGELQIKLKQTTYDNSNVYDNLIDELKKTQVLYIDDLFKFEPTKRDKEELFNILNARYNLAKNEEVNIITIISSEQTLAEFALIDEAIAGRIIEMCKNGYVINIKKDIKKNKRLKDLIKEKEENE